MQPGDRPPRSRETAPPAPPRRRPAARPPHPSGTPRQPVTQRWPRPPGLRSSGPDRPDRRGHGKPRLRPAARPVQLRPDRGERLVAGPVQPQRAAGPSGRSARKTAFSRAVIRRGAVPAAQQRQRLGRQMPRLGHTATPASARSSVATDQIGVGAGENSIGGRIFSMLRAPERAPSARPPRASVSTTSRGELGAGAATPSRDRTRAAKNSPAPRTVGDQRVRQPRAIAPPYSRPRRRHAPPDPRRSITSSTAIAAAAATGLPPKVLK